MQKLILDGHKLAWYKDRVDDWLAGKKIAPVTIDCALSRKCTYNCVYCYGQLQKNPEKKLDRGVIFRFLDDAAEIGVKGVSFVSDGESTCNPHLYDSIIHGKKNGLDMALGTNGFLLERNRLQEILRDLTYLRFNISAGEPERYSEIHGCPVKCYHTVIENIRECVALKKKHNFDVTIGLQMVLLPEFADQILPLVNLGEKLGVDYLVIKHCSDDEDNTLGVDYSKYHDLKEILKKAESYSTETYSVQAKWSKIFSEGKREYTRCFGPPFILQISGSGLLAPCGMLFNSKYKKYHIGNIAETSFKKLWESDRYWEVMNLIASPAFDARTMCGTLCLQHKVNEVLWNIRENGTALEVPDYPQMHKSFI